MAASIRMFVTSCVLCIFSVAPSLAQTGTITAMSPSASAFGSNGGTGQITVEATPPWSASTQSNWITITSVTSFTTSGTVSYTVSPNVTGMPRTGTIEVGNQLFTVRQPGASFSDNTDTAAWPYPYINAVAAAGITKGCGNNSFCPGDPVTREQMAAFMIRALKGENFTYTQQPHFMDVSPGGWSYPYIQAMKDLGLTANTGSFEPSGTVTREQMAAFVIRALYGENFDYPSTPYFTDVSPSEWPFKYVQKMKQQGLTANSGTFNPTDVVTRAQMATMMSRAFLGMMPSSSQVPSNNTAFTAGMIMGKTLQINVPSVGGMTYTFNEDGTYAETVTNGMGMTGAYSGNWMINSDGTMTLDNVQGMMAGYTETFTMVGGGGVMSPMVNYMNSLGMSGTGMPMRMM